VRIRALKIIYYFLLFAFGIHFDSLFFHQIIIRFVILEKVSFPFFGLIYCFYFLILTLKAQFLYFIYRLVFLNLDFFLGNIYFQLQIIDFSVIDASFLIVFRHAFLINFYIVCLRFHFRFLFLNLICPFLLVFIVFLSTHFVFLLDLMQFIDISFLNILILKFVFKIFEFIILITLSIIKVF